MNSRPEATKIQDRIHKFFRRYTRLTREAKHTQVRRYYLENPLVHDAAFVADYLDLTVGEVHDVRAGRCPCCKEFHIRA